MPVGIDDVHLWEEIKNLLPLKDAEFIRYELMPPETISEDQDILYIKRVVGKFINQKEDRH